MAMRHLQINGARLKTYLGLFCTAFIIISAVVYSRQQKKILIVENLETGEIYAETPIETGDEVEFEWEHSFEHIPWHEYYEVEKDGSFMLHTISVAGFGAGIPAEMDCDYRYEDGLIYMEGIGSRFDQFNWINSQTALKQIRVNGDCLLKGTDMPHHKKIELYIEERKEEMQ